jgi:hypothetical protein
MDRGCVVGILYDELRVVQCAMLCTCQLGVPSDL